MKEIDHKSPIEIFSKSFCPRLFPMAAIHSASLLKNIYNVATFTKIITNADALYINQNRFFSLLNKMYQKHTKIPSQGKSQEIMI